MITVYGEMDDDGFLNGEINGRRGLVPSNFLQHVNKKYIKSGHGNQGAYASKGPDLIKVNLLRKLYFFINLFRFIFIRTNKFQPTILKSNIFSNFFET